MIDVRAEARTISENGNFSELTKYRLMRDIESLVRRAVEEERERSVPLESELRRLSTNVCEVDVDSIFRVLDGYNAQEKP